MSSISSINISVDPTKFPAPSQEVVGTLKRLAPESKIFPFYENHAQKIRNIQTVRSMIQEANDHDTRHKVFACLQTALVVATAALFIVGLVAVSASTGGAGLASSGLFVNGLFGYLFSSLAIGAIASHQIEEIEKLRPNYQHNLPEALRYFCYFPTHPGVFPVGPLFGASVIAPLHEAFTRKSRLEEVEKELEYEILQEFAKLEEPNAYEQTFTEALGNSLSKQREEIVESPIWADWAKKTEVNVESLRADIAKNHQEAQEYLEKAQAFLHSLKA